VGGAAIVICIVIVLVVFLVIKPFDKGSEAEPTPTVTLEVVDQSPTVEPTATITPTAELPPVESAPLLTSVAGDGIVLTVSANPVQVGSQLTVTVIYTNTGGAFARDLKLYLEGTWKPALNLIGEAAVLTGTGEIAPQATYTGTFVLEAVEAGSVSLEASVATELNTDPPSPDLRQVGPLEVSVESAP
jgi:hypothetical protein